MSQTQIRFAISRTKQSKALDRCRVVFNATVRFLLKNSMKPMPVFFHDGHFSSVPDSFGLPYKPFRAKLFRTKARVSLLCVVVHLLLEVATDEHDGKREAKIERPKQQEATEEIVVRGANLAHGLSKLDNCDHRKQR